MATLRLMPGPVFCDVRDAFPAATQLAALGPVLCLYRTQQGSELAGWQQAVRVEVHTGVGSDGLDERLLFFDAQGRCCWRLCLLPDSDFVAWDRLAASLPAGRDADAGGLADRLWREGTGGANRVARLHLLTQPPSLDAGEVTDKGSINQRAVLKARAAIVDALYDGTDPAAVVPSK